MKFVAYETAPGSAPRVGVLDAEAAVVRPVPVELAPDGLLSVIELSGNELAGNEVAGNELAGTGAPAVPLGDLRLLAPIPRPRRNLLCVGKNYVAHAAEFSRSGKDATAGTEVPDTPIIFTKATTTVVGPDHDVEAHTGLTKELDYESELAVVIGVGGRGIAPGDAMRHVWGYTLVNDITARDLQYRHKQWHLGKSLDTSCPMGPWAVTADEIDLAAITLRCTVNGELRQSAPVSDLVFDVPTLIATLSAGMTLLPGDIIATGTPAGVGIGFDPPRYLAPGDVVEVSADGLGVLRNTIV